MSEPAPNPPSGSALPQFGQYVLVGLTGVIVNLVVFSLALSALTGRPVTDLIGSLTHATSATSDATGAILIASVIAFVVATLWNYALNNAWTFRSHHRRRHSSGRRLALYYGVSLASLGINELVLYGLIAFVPPLYGQAAGIVAGSVVGFLGNRRFTFAETVRPSLPRESDPADAAASPRDP